MLGAASASATPFQPPVASSHTNFFLISRHHTFRHLPLTASATLSTSDLLSDRTGFILFLCNYYHPPFFFNLYIFFFNLVLGFLYFQRGFLLRCVSRKEKQHDIWSERREANVFLVPARRRKMLKEIRRTEDKRNKDPSSSRSKRNEEDVPSIDSLVKHHQVLSLVGLWRLLHHQGKTTKEWLKIVHFYTFFQGCMTGRCLHS